MLTSVRITLVFTLRPLLLPLNLVKLNWVETQFGLPIMFIWSSINILNKIVPQCITLRSNCSFEKLRLLKDLFDSKNWYWRVFMTCWAVHKLIALVSLKGQNGGLLVDSVSLWIIVSQPYCILPVSQLLKDVRRKINLHLEILHMASTSKFGWLCS